MSEAEKRLRGWIRSFHPGVYVQAEEDLTAMLSAARDAALEEAKGVAERCAALGFEAADVAEHLTGLQAAPAQVRTVQHIYTVLIHAKCERPVKAVERAVDAIADDLGVDLNATTSDGSPDDLCTACRVPKRRHAEYGCREFQPAAHLGADE